MPIIWRACQLRNMRLTPRGKYARQVLLTPSRDLPPADKRDTLALRLSDFIRDLDRYEKDLLSVVGRSDLANITAEQMEQHLSALLIVQQLIDFLAQVQWKTSDSFSAAVMRGSLPRSYVSCTLLHYLYHEGDVVYIGADKYEIMQHLPRIGSTLQNVEFPLFGQEYSRATLKKS